MVNRHELPRTPPRSPNNSVNFSSEKCNGNFVLLNEEVKASNSHIQYKNDLSSEVDNYYGEGKLNNDTFIRHGLGTYYYSEGAKYFGKWSMNKKIGLGVFIYSNGVISFGIRDIFNQISSSIIFWPDPSLSNTYSQAFIGEINYKAPLNGLFYLKSSSKPIDSNEMTHFFYFGKRNGEDKKEDDEAILYDFIRNFLFFGSIKNDIIVMGYEVMLSNIFAVENILFIVRDYETNKVKEVVEEKYIAIVDVNLIHRRANAFIQNFLKGSSLVSEFDSTYTFLVELNKKTKDVMPSKEVMKLMEKRSEKIKNIINKIIKNKEG